MLSRERFVSYGIILLLGSALIYFVLINDEQYVEDYNLKINDFEYYITYIHHQKY